MSTISRTLRFNFDEINLIEEFLNKNPLYYFSSLTRLALKNFIQNPKLAVHFVNRSSQKLAKFYNQNLRGKMNKDQIQIEEFLNKVVQYS